MTAAYTYNPDYAVAPGQTLREALEERGMTQEELANRTELSRKTINEILAGKAPITPETAMKLELATGIPGSFWNRLESTYRERLALLQQRTALVADVEWCKQFPYAELVKRKAVKDTRDTAERVKELYQFFAVSGRTAWESVWQKSPQAVFRRVNTVHDKTYVTATWLRLAQIEATKVQCKPFQTSMFQQNIYEIRKLTTKSPNEFVPQMKELCTSAGVALVLVPEFKGAAVNGAAFWLGDRPVIALCLRGKSNDKFWFTFFHEAMHILHHGKRVVYLDMSRSNSENQQIEDEANHHATNLLIPPNFQERLRCARSEREIRDLANELSLHVGIVVGQYQHLKNEYTHWNELKIKLAWAHESNTNN